MIVMEQMESQQSYSNLLSESGILNQTGSTTENYYPELLKSEIMHYFWLFFCDRLEYKSSYMACQAWYILLCYIALCMPLHVSVKQIESNPVDNI